jgi:hypothetical protein
MGHRPIHPPPDMQSACHFSAWYDAAEHALAAGEQLFYCAQEAVLTKLGGMGTDTWREGLVECVARARAQDESPDIVLLYGNGSSLLIIPPLRLMQLLRRHG